MGKTPLLKYISFMGFERGNAPLLKNTNKPSHFIFEMIIWKITLTQRRTTIIFIVHYPHFYIYVLFLKMYIYKNIILYYNINDRPERKSSISKNPA